MDDDQLLRITAEPTDVETLAASNKRLREIVEEQRLLLDATRRERDEREKAARWLLPFLVNEPVHQANAVSQWPWLEEALK